MLVVSGLHIDNVTILVYLFTVGHGFSHHPGVEPVVIQTNSYAFSLRLNGEGLGMGRQKKFPFHPRFASSPFNVCYAGNSLFESCKVFYRLFLCCVCFPYLHVAKWLLCLNFRVLNQEWFTNHFVCSNTNLF